MDTRLDVVRTYLCTVICVDLLACMSVEATRSTNSAADVVFSGIV